MLGDATKFYRCVSKMADGAWSSVEVGGKLVDISESENVNT